MYGLVRILLAAAITAWTRGGAPAGGISSPSRSSLAFAVGAHSLTVAAVRPPVLLHAAEAPLGSVRANAASAPAPAAANPAFSLSLCLCGSKPISFVGLRG